LAVKYVRHLTLFVRDRPSPPGMRLQATAWHRVQMHRAAYAVV
jgi:hypothetical protein